MTGGPNPPDVFDLQSLMHLASQSLDRGEVARAREFAKVAFERARASHQTHAEAHALVCLANCDRLTWRMRRAGDASRRAAHLFASVGDAQGEGAALAILAHVSSLLGRNDDAIEAGLLGLRLTAASAPDLATVTILNYLGVAYGWSGRFAEAQSTLDAAIEMSAHCTPPVNPVQPIVNLAWFEAFRIVSIRDRMQLPASTARLEALVQRCADLASSGSDPCLVPSALVSLKAMLALLNALHCCWTGKAEDARAWLEQGHQWLDRTPLPTWLTGIAHLVEGESAFWMGQPDAAIHHFHVATQTGAQVEHEQLICLGHLLTSQLLATQGRHAEALLAMRMLRDREVQARTEGHESRSRVVDLELTARRNSQDIVRLSAAARQFERWSMEDALTGLANRRRFESQLVERMRSAAESGQPLCLALIDVDRFKQINDTCSHLIGDRVLKSIADVLVAQVREHDLVARLAGDEFVIVLPHIDIHDAQQVAQRIQIAVQEHLWTSLATSLAVSVSIGAAAFQAGDTVEVLIARSDAAMYAHKARHGGAPSTSLAVPSPMDAQAAGTPRDTE